MHDPGITWHKNRTYIFWMTLNHPLGGLDSCIQFLISYPKSRVQCAEYFSKGSFEEYSEP